MKGSTSDLAEGTGRAKAHVASFLARDLVILAAEAGVEPDMVFDGTPFDAQSIYDPEALLVWADYSRMWANVAERVSDDELIAMGRDYLELDSALPIKDLATSIQSAFDLYRTFGGTGRQATIACLDHAFEELPDGRLRVSTRMAPGYEPSRGFLLSRHGLLEALPTMMGLPMARVEYGVLPDGAHYIIDVPLLVSRRARFLHRLRKGGALLRSRRRLDRSIRLLNERHDSAQRLNSVLEAKLLDVNRRQERFVHLFRAAPVAMLICRASDMVVLDVNDKFLRSSGYDRSTVMKWMPEDMGGWVDLSDRDVVFEAIAHAGGQIDGFEVRVRHADGHDMVSLMSVEQVELDGEACLLFQSIDITDRKRAENELAEYRNRLEDLVEERSEELRRSNESLRQFERLASIGTLAAGMAHQINNPVGAIRAASEFALKVGPQGEEGEQSEETRELRRALELCVEQSQRCGEIVRNILAFSRGEATGREPHDLREIVTRSCDMVAGYAQEGRAVIHANPGEEPVPVFVNPVEIEQVLVNVLRNAVECVDGEVQIEVSVALLPTGAFIEVRDDGPGVGPDEAPYLFDPFYTTRLEVGGTGLGLSVAHGIVNAHGGAIRADTALERGTAIQILLPVSEMPINP